MSQYLNIVLLLSHDMWLCLYSNASLLSYVIVVIEGYRDVFLFYDMDVIRWVFICAHDKIILLFLSSCSVILRHWDMDI